jgi:murein DD-endopeptidase MepM/ murein hydrolase activator NlpD
VAVNNASNRSEQPSLPSKVAVVRAKPTPGPTVQGNTRPPRRLAQLLTWPRGLPGVQTLVAIFTALALAVVGTVAGIQIKNYKAPQSVQTIRLGKTGTDTLKGKSADPLSTSTGAPVASKGSNASVVSAVAPLVNRVDPDLFLSTATTLTPNQITAVTRVTGATRVLAVDYAQVHLGKGISSAIGVNPSSFRQYTPDNTAPVDALWQRVASGDAAIAHAVALALQVKLGGHTMAGRVTQTDVRVGAFATTRLPGVGVVVDRSKSAALGLVHNAALIMVLPAGADPLVALASAVQLLPQAKVQALRYSASGNSPGGPQVPGGVPILGRGWTLPMALGTFTLTQRYHYPNGHPGIDLAAPFGTPIYAAAEGDVLYWGPAQGFGNWIVLQHPGGIQTVYGHMRYDELLIGPTAHVKAGQLIAREGSEGNSTGPHLHFEVHINNVRTDPIAFLNAEGVTEIR